MMTIIYVIDQTELNTITLIAAVGTMDIKWYKYALKRWNNYGQHSTCFRSLNITWQNAQNDIYLHVPMLYNHQAQFDAE